MIFDIMFMLNVTYFWLNTFSKMSKIVKILKKMKIYK